MHSCSPCCIRVVSVPSPHTLSMPADLNLAQLSYTVHSVNSIPPSLPPHVCCPQSGTDMPYLALKGPDPILLRPLMFHLAPAPAPPTLPTPSSASPFPSASRTPLRAWTPPRAYDLARVLMQNLGLPRVPRFTSLPPGLSVCLGGEGRAAFK